uniref:peptidylprolyl isomerase n=1 Tax=Coccolithus braarudii TaxID=221442 RepID=A0A7S0PYG7_9EUKA|mmetsp:Transcript_26738/g.57755  ORF Transcript_26738/g.57755 Transcript_26738/m.57755 type:complete len:205 (+) Transcript_26738:19-633(+)|eukprot:CAMPEP_0183332238 /NCGR_PEP_ID=MMETSP0164_2-20130417/1454_1 /TAXON_ID=221442 /ORGANISM="Coccolithus pelagicus ssp braarudi, Strain PLY182g" /LENGTH=204 /DNA_ID=CAMNT_0025500911 /DNA_START=12 /DNA_END=626 /DNA_ORIENTATION=+
MKVFTFLLIVAIAAAFAPVSRLPHSRRLLSTPRRASHPLSIDSVQIPDETWSTTASGLRYFDEAIGDGESPQKGDVVKVMYTGWLESTGDQFDSSRGRDPIAFALGTGKVIPGWDEGIAGMRVGGKRQLSIPSTLGYGANGAGSAIPPGASLQFECELVGVESGVSGFMSTFPGGKQNLVLAAVLALSFVPYFLPVEMRPPGWK